MKLRIERNSIRLRLTVSEVAAIGMGNPVEGVRTFPSSNVLTYRLVPCASSDRVHAEFEDRTIAVRIPSLLGARWAADARFVSVHGDVGELTILIEKDFACLDPAPGEDQSDRFINPKSACP